MSKEIIGIINQLLPGFLVAWIVYGLTAYLKPSPFERIVQALIFTVIVRAIVIGVRRGALIIGETYYFGYWNDEVELIYSITIASVLGLIFTWAINNDFPLFMFRKEGDEPLSKRCLLVKKILSRIRLTIKRFILQSGILPSILILDI